MQTRLQGDIRGLSEWAMTQQMEYIVDKYKFLEGGR